MRLTGVRARLPDLAALHGELVRRRRASSGIHSFIEFGNRMLTFVLAVVAIATWVVAMRYRPRRRVAAPAGDRARARCPGPGGARRLHRAHRPEPVGRRAAPPAVPGDGLGRGRPRAPRRRGGPATDADDAASGRPADLGDVRRDLDGAVRRHRGHRLGTACRGRGLTADRAAARRGEPGARRPGVPAGRADRRHAWSPSSSCGHPTAPCAPCRGCSRSSWPRGWSASCSTSPTSRSSSSACTSSGAALVVACATWTLLGTRDRGLIRT